MNGFWATILIVIITLALAVVLFFMVQRLIP